MKKKLSDEEVFTLLDIMCHGRPYSASEVWSWLESDDIEGLKNGEMTIFNVAMALDCVQKHGGKLDPSGHQLPVPSLCMLAEREADSESMRFN